MAAGDRLPPVAELERHFQVATSTVVSALDALQGEGLIVRRHGSGTFVADRGAAATPGGTDASPVAAPAGMVAVLSLPDSGHGLFVDMLRAAERALRAQGKAPVLILDADFEQRFRWLRGHWERREIAGFLHLGSVLAGEVPEDIPGVVAGEFRGSGAVLQVAPDNIGGGRQAGEHLWDLGHRRVAFLHSEMLAVVAAPRWQGFHAVWQERGAGDQALSVTVPHVGGGGERGVRALLPHLEPLLAGPNPVTAFFAVNDLLAAQVIAALQGAGRRVPEDVSVIGYDDMEPLASFLRPALTTIRMPGTVLGTLAAQMLCDRLAHSAHAPPPPALRVPTELILRDSTAAP